MKATKRKKLEKAGWKVGTAKQFLARKKRKPKKASKSRSKNSTRSKPSQAKRKGRKKAKGKLKVIRHKKDDYSSFTEYAYVPSPGRVGGYGGYAYGGPVV